jgi:hypothetical protein
MRDVESQWELSRASKLLQIVSLDDKLHISVGFVSRHDHLMWPWDKQTSLLRPEALWEKNLDTRRLRNED